MNRDSRLKREAPRREARRGPKGESGGARSAIALNISPIPLKAEDEMNDTTTTADGRSGSDEPSGSRPSDRAQEVAAVPASIPNAGGEHVHGC